MSERLRTELHAISREPLSYERERFSLDIEVHSRAAVLALFRGESFLSSEILLILRSKHLAIHAGEVALPGGGMEPEDHQNSVTTAIRECFEEVGIPPELVESIGLLPMLPTISGRAAVDPVLAILRAPAEMALELDQNEVAHAEWASVRKLKDSRRYETRSVRGVEMEFPYFQWENEKMWGLTALIFDLILKRYDKLFS